MSGNTPGFRSWERRSPRIRVLVVDDSAMSQLIVRRGLEGVAECDVVGVATSAYEARTKILELRPDVVTLDLDLPGIHGLVFLEKLMQFVPIPTVVVSGLVGRDNDLTERALALGAVAVVRKTDPGESPRRFTADLSDAVRAAAKCVVREIHDTDPGNPRAEDFIIAIGSSTGGPRTLESVLELLDATAPPVLVVQHMPAGFTGPLAEHLDRSLTANVREAQDGDRLESGLVLIAPAGHHMVLSPVRPWRVTLRQGPRVQQQRPAADMLFASVAKHAGRNAVGVLLTGMGADGAEGLGMMRKAGARTIAQSERTCVVFGMPKVAIERGAAMQVLGDREIARALAAWGRNRRHGHR